MSADRQDWPAGVDRLILPETDSTMAEGARQAAAFTAPTWICALAQTAGRGRRGRAWAMPAGNFAASLVMRPAGPPAQAALRSFVAALALRDALVAVTGRAEVFTLKWPNDVLLNGGKLAGILLESSGAAGRVDALVIGIGVNLAATPDTTLLEAGALAPVSLLGQTGITITPEDFLTHLAQHFARWEAQFTTHGFGPIRNAWLQNAARIGQNITARMMRDEITGTFVEIDTQGQLVLETPKGRQTIAAADIFF
ncbi:MAG: biotin--[acetyl-CoA-carboxylase] ligase [Roseicyclus sp.]|uniref:biotin--[acetyl-CoA-carboxylase] ligase n=1 Tax=Roseicyclus sp. TaxID=1914329 RepID=UPI003BB1395E